MSTTPVPASALLGAQVAVNLLFAVVSIALLLGVGAGAFNLVLPLQFGWFVLSLALAVAAMFGIGLCIAALAGSAAGRECDGIGPLLPVGLLFGVVLPARRDPRRRDRSDRKGAALRCRVRRPPCLARRTLPRLGGDWCARRLRGRVRLNRSAILPMGRREIRATTYVGANRLVTTYEVSDSAPGGTCRSRSPVDRRRGVAQNQGYALPCIHLWQQDCAGFGYPGRVATHSVSRR